MSDEKPASRPLAQPTIHYEPSNRDTKIPRRRTTFSVVDHPQLNSIDDSTREVKISMHNELRRFERDIIRMKTMLSKELSGSLSTRDLVGAVPVLMVYASSINSADGLTRKAIVTRVMTEHIQEHSGRLQDKALTALLFFLKHLLSHVIDSIFASVGMTFGRSGVQKCSAACSSLVELN